MKALFYTLIPGLSPQRSPLILCVTEVRCKRYHGVLLDGTRDAVRPNYCFGKFDSLIEARLVWRQFCIVHAAHRIRTRPLRDELAALERDRDAELQALLAKRAPAPSPQENCHVA